MARREPSRYPVFYDQNQNRWRWITRLSFALLAVVICGGAVFAVSVLALPFLPHHALPHARAAREWGNPDPSLTDRQKERHRYVQKRTERELRRLVAQDKQRLPAGIQTVRVTPDQPIVAGFYVNWEETALASLHRNVDRLTHFFPEWLHLQPDGKTFADGRNREDRADVEPFVHAHGLPILPILNNYIPARSGEAGDWSSEAVHALLVDPSRRARCIAQLRDFVRTQGWQGINIDFEQVPPEDRDDLTAFMTELAAAFHPAGLLVTQDVQLEEAGFDLLALGRVNDLLLPMLYDEHSPGDENGAGSIASQFWTQQQLQNLFRLVPADKVVLALGNYAYDWKRGETAAASLSYQSAMIQAKESLDPDDPHIARIQVDPRTLNPFYRYNDDKGAEHTVWMLDATTTYNQWHVAQKYHPRGMALWYLGGEDPGVWSVIERGRITQDQGQAIDKGALGVVSYGRQSQVDFEGEGELLTVIAEPADGHREVRRDARSGLITHETYQNYPSGYVVRRAGHLQKKIVLTFDDGPDPVWTPQILDILKREGVPAAFFIVGQEAEAHPDLIARIWNEGHELGNHTFTHPDLSRTGEKRTLLEISTTQRLLESITGHSTTLFRPPFAIDVEPNTGEELKPILLASRYNFLSVGEQNDPRDWNLTARGPQGETGADRIVQSAWDDRDTGNVILLHDGGGDREATVAALPRLIDRLKAAGYQFTTIAELRGMPRTALFPAITGRENLLVGVDRWVFEGTYTTQRVLVTLFTLSILLGITRQLWMGVLALIQWRRERRRETSFIPGYGFSITVLIAAYNEEKVIARTIQSILNSSYPVHEVIVVDDGSTDETSRVVTETFANDPRVRCLHKTNGGKASALNYGLTFATGEILVALDADTLFAPDTIGRLARHFADPSVGAVAGNVRVGNANNILTRWQALEYVTSQNFDRRAYDLLNCITVVPGAVGAWRHEAVVSVGGYTSDTLAEDTDLTWTIRRAGWRIVNDSSALAFTEAPETLRNLSRQRFRWAFGTLQNLWKHRGALGRYGAFGWIALPGLWLYQILFPAISPLMDIAVVWSLWAGNFTHIAGYYLLVIGLEFIGATLALWMDKGDWRLLPGLFLQRFVYRQLMYYVILKSAFSALRGGAVGWNKFERRGTAKLATVTPES